MNIERTAQVSPWQSALKNKTDHQAAALKLTNNQIKADGQATLKLLDSATQLSTGSIGSNINVKV